MQDSAGLLQRRRTYGQEGPVTQPQTNRIMQIFRFENQFLRVSNKTIFFKKTQHQKGLMQVVAKPGGNCICMAQKFQSQ
eukprot:1978813-Pleurochrysis_carterae.AAC.1